MQTAAMKTPTPSTIDGAERRLSVRLHPVPAPLRGGVQYAWSLRGQWRAGADWLLPDIGIDLSVQIPGATAAAAAGIDYWRNGDWQPLPACAVVGSLGAAVPLRYRGDIHVWGLRLAPADAGLLGLRAAELRDRILPLADCAPWLARQLADFAAALAEGRRTPADVWPVLAAAPPVLPAADVQQAARLLQQAPWRTAALAAHVGYSRRHFNRRFQAQLGCTPAEFRRLARFGRAVAQLSAAPAAQGAELAVAAGYYDQAHWIRECKRYCGMTPSALFNAGWYENFVFLDDIPAR